MSQPTSSSTKIPPTPSPSTTASPGVTPSTSTPQGPKLSEAQLMGHYALLTMGVKVSTIKKLEPEDLNEFPNLLIVSKETLDELKTNGIINAVNRDAIVKFQSWHKKYLSYGNSPLKTKAELSQVFDTDVLNDFMSQSSNSSQSSQNTPNAISTTKNPDINTPTTIDYTTTKPLDLTKFPSWNGRKDTWDTFHTKLKAILSMNKLRRLLEKDKKNKVDSEQLYHILAHCIVNGLMKNTALQYESSLNGIQAWKDLYTIMEQTELDNVIEFQGLANLVTLEKKHGFESFLNDYHAAMKKADPDGSMKESKKKFYLLHAIKKDTRYAYRADACDNESLLKTITKLRIKAQELKDLGHSSNRNHNNTSTTTRSNKKKWNRNYKPSGGGNKTPHNSGSSGANTTANASNRLPSSLFNKASPEEKKMIIQLQNKARGNNYNATNQYPKGDGNKKTSGATNAKDDKAPTRKVNVTQQAQAQDTSTYSGIFSPARKMNFSKSKRDKTSIVSMEKEWDIEVPLPYSANRDMAFKEKLGEIILAFNHPVYTKHGDILQVFTLKEFPCHSHQTEEPFKHNKLNKKQAYQSHQKELHFNWSQAFIWMSINETRGILCDNVPT